MKKPGTKNIRIITVSFLLLATVNISVSSQENITGKGKMYMGIVITPQRTSIINKDFSASPAVGNKKGTTINFAFEVGYFFSKMAGISVGAGTGSYSTVLSADTCSFEFQDTDSDNELYEMQVRGRSIKENQKIHFLSIPVCLMLRYPAGEKDSKVAFIAKAGVSFDIPVVKTYKGSGTFSYSGYYSEYNVLFRNIPGYFPDNVSTSSSDNLDVKLFNTTMVASAGISYSINNSLQVTIAINFNRSLGNISGYKNGAGYKLTSKPDEMNSIMGGTSKAGVQGTGVSFGLKYYIR